MEPLQGDNKKVGVGKKVGRVFFEGGWYPHAYYDLLRNNKVITIQQDTEALFFLGPKMFRNCFLSFCGVFVNTLNVVSIFSKINK